MGEWSSNEFDAYRTDIDDLLAFEFGSAAHVRRLDLAETGPAADIIRNATLSLPADFYTLWISHSLPEVATYKVSNAPFSIICHSQDHAFYCSKVRRLFDRTIKDEGMVADLCFYLLSKITGELALKYSDADMAVLIYTFGLDDNRGWHLVDSDNYSRLLPFSGDQVFDLFVLLNHLHEMGHDPSVQRRFANLPSDHLLAEAGLLAMIHDVLYPSLFPETIKEKALELARTSEGGHGFSLERLKEEIVADFYAADGFLRYLLLLNAAAGSAKRELDLIGLLCEYAIYPFLVGVIQRCQFCAKLLGDDSYSKDEKLFRGDLQDIAIRVRIVALIHWQHQVLHRVVSSPYTGIAHQALVTEELNDVQRSINRAAVAVNRELREVRHCCIRLQDSSTKVRQTNACKERLLNPDVGFRIELEEFCKKADSFNKDSSLLQYLRTVIRKA